MQEEILFKNNFACYIYLTVDRTKNYYLPVIEIGLIKDAMMDFS